ncbi:hypothetical protein PG988_012295, partial [Apiospora saccharicola]
RENTAFGNADVGAHVVASAHQDVAEFGVEPHVVPVLAVRRISAERHDMWRRRRRRHLVPVARLSLSGSGGGVLDGRIITEVAEVGLMVVPGGVAVKGAGKVIQYAKSAYENGMNAANFFTHWIGPACGVPNWSFCLDDMFLDMAKAPDSMVGSDLPTGCLRKNKKDCKRIDKKEDPKEGTEVHRGKNPDENKEDEENKRKEEESKKKKKEEEEKKKSCKIRRAPAPYVPESTRTVKKFGEDEIRTTKECVSGKNEDVVHITRTDSNIGHYIQARSDMPKIVCKSEHTQACYYYTYVFDDSPGGAVSRGIASLTYEQQKIGHVPVFQDQRYDRVDVSANSH